MRGEQTKALILELERLQGIEDQKNRFEGLAEERAHIAQSIMDAVSEDIIMAGNFSIFWVGIGIPKVLGGCPWHASICRVHAQRKILYQFGRTSSSCPCTATHKHTRAVCMHAPSMPTLKLTSKHTSPVCVRARVYCRAHARRKGASIKKAAKRNSEQEQDACQSK